MKNSTNPPLILIEDEEDYALGLKPLLRMKGLDYEVITDTRFGNVEPGDLDAFVARTRALIEPHRARVPILLLDLALHKIRPNAWELGFAVGKRLRETFYELPIMVLTSHKEKFAEGYLYDFDAFENKDEFGTRDATEIVGLLTRTAQKRRTMIENLPLYYKQHVQLKGGDLGLTCFNAYGHQFTGTGGNLEQLLDDAAKIADYFAKHPRLTVILFADLAGSTRLKLEHGFLEGLRLVRMHNQIITELIAKSGGTVVKYIGDAVMARYDYDVANDEQVKLTAVNVAIQINERFRELSRADPNARPILTKIGIDIGQVADFYGNDPHGSAVDRAARIQSHAAAEQILVSRDLIQRCGNQGPNRLYSRLGDANGFKPEDYLSKVIPLKCNGFKDMVDAHEIHWSGPPGAKNPPAGPASGDTRL